MGVAIANVVIVGVLRVHLSLSADLGLEVLIVFTALALPFGLTIATLWRQLRLTIGIVADGPAQATPILLGFVREELKALEERIVDMRSCGIDLERGVVSPWVRTRCFAVTSGPYCTTDVLVPSVFLATYSEFLEAHAHYVATTGTPSVRINVAPSSELAVDQARNPDAWRRYRDWHTTHGVELLHCEHANAQSIARQQGLGTTIDVALWNGELAVLVDYHDDGKTNLRIALVGEPWYRRCHLFFQDVFARAESLDAAHRTCSGDTPGTSSTGTLALDMTPIVSEGVDSMSKESAGNVSETLDRKG